MPSVRSLILLAVLLLVVSLITSGIALLQEPDSGGRGQDTYGTQGYGFRAVFEVLDELDVAVRRQFAPPNPRVSEVTWALLAPDPRLTGVNPTYIQSLATWVEGGGRLFVAPREMGRAARWMRDESAGEMMESINQTLGLSDVEIHSHWRPPEATPRPAHSNHTLDTESLAEEFLRSWTRETFAPRIVNAELEGSLEKVGKFIGELALPGGGHHSLTFTSSQPRGTISYKDDDGKRRILAAEFARGKGDIVILAEPELFGNQLLALSDNSVLAVHLLAPREGEVVFDEFYHGLGVRGNPLYLFTRPGYAAVALGLLLYVVLLSWREAVLIGPALPDESQQRRDIGEYLVAMGQFFSRGKATRPFLLKQLRAGVLRELSLAVSLPPETQDPNLIADSLARRDPRRGQRVKETIAEVDAALESRHHWTESQTLDAMRRLTSCL